MKIILDTHIFLWALGEPDKLSDNQRFELETLSNIIYVSSISIAEIMIKSSIGKLNIEINPMDLAKESGFELLDFTGFDAMSLKDLPFHHKDPFDRMLISQGIVNKMKIMTSDRKFAAYDCKII